MQSHSPLAVLADIHGNSLALDAVLADAQRRGITRFVNLGDTFYGPLDPAGTWNILKDLNIPTILGNQDRILLEGGEQWETIPAFQAALDGLSHDGLDWVKALPTTLRMDEEVLLCHGTPHSDMQYLLEDVTSGQPEPRPCNAVEDDLFPQAQGCSLVLAGHSHFPDLRHCNGMTIVNPGSVGLPAYDDDTPPHVMASRTPHAKYASVMLTPCGWHVEFINVEYDWQAAADMARANDRPDWADWLLTGTASPAR